MGMSSHQSARPQSVDWLTPPSILGRLGAFDLDPCCPKIMPWPTATRMICVPQDGLAADWDGRVWLNPPFGNAARPWAERLAKHGNGIALLPARTETRLWQEFVFGKASGVLFLAGRPHFYGPDGTRGPHNCGAPIALVAYGVRNLLALSASGLAGYLVDVSGPLGSQNGGVA